jgi:hypothetical protein
MESESKSTHHAVILDLNSQQWQKNSTVSEHYEQAPSAARAMGHSRQFSKLHTFLCSSTAELLVSQLVQHTTKCVQLPSFW